MKNLAKFFGFMVISFSFVCFSQHEVPLTGNIPYSQLPYAYQNQSDYKTNIDFQIDRLSAAGKTIDSAIGVRIARNGKDYVIEKKMAEEAVYDSVTASTYDRIVYEAKEIPKEIPNKILVSADLKQVEPQQQFQAYFAEVKVGKKKVKEEIPTTTTKVIEKNVDRYEFKKKTAKAED